jgi:hypothetical protein
MPPEDSPEHDFVRLKNAAALAEAKHYLSEQFSKLK